MISKSMQENLRKNRFRIAALQRCDPQTAECLYLYEDGTMCAASACFDDDFRAFLADSRNRSTICGIQHLDGFSEYYPYFPILSAFQNLHDDLLRSRYSHKMDVGPLRTKFIIMMCSFLDGTPE